MTHLKVLKVHLFPRQPAYRRLQNNPHPPEDRAIFLLQTSYVSTQKM